MNLILGSGIVGLLAKKILGDDWTIIPFKRSRYFAFEIPWSDNYIKFDKKVDDFMRSILPKDTPTVFYQTPFSYGGQLMYQTFQVTTDPYLNKIYGEDVPKLAPSLLQTTFMVYPVTAKAMYEALQRKYLNEIKQNISKYGEVATIDVADHKVKFKGKDTEVTYDKIISTIPLDGLCERVGLGLKLVAKPVVYYHIITDSVDLEGAQQSYVCDREIEFFKVQMLNKTNYLFWCFEALPDAYKFFGSVLGYGINIMESTRITDVIPMGEPPDLKPFEEHGIYCVGSNAQWDDFMDISSCIKRLINISATLG